ncbi:cupin domain-containing protein [Aquibacillus kalidii]|uniref:hypothetical protein n=1 Tax=Aquibacillus kalidii TaxID=2762597 RepID=UPI0016474BB3|nr:hypothetical protein [Aquibacillus kalidii]
MNKVNVKDKFSLFKDYWSLKIVGQVNDAHVKLAKLRCLSPPELTQFLSNLFTLTFMYPPHIVVGKRKVGFYIG